MPRTKTNWNTIYVDLSPKLLGICRRYITDLQTAEDLLQDSFIIAMQKSHQLKDKKALFGWLKTIVVNNALQHLRKNTQEIFVSTEISEIPEPLTEMNNSATEKNNILIYDFTKEELLKSIDSLPVHHRSVFNLYFIEKNSHSEISKLLGISVNTSKSHLLRAKKAVQNYLINNIVNQNTPKNKTKTTQLLVLLGLGGWAWAQTFQNKFSDFSIYPSKELVIPENFETNSFSYSVSDKNLQKKLIITATFFIVLFLSIYINKDNHKFFQNFSSEPLVNVKNESSVENHFSPQIKAEVIEKTQTDRKGLNDVNLNKKTETQKTSDIDKSKEKIIKPKDSLENNPKKVIIVKKVIQRDTIFIEREN